MMSSLAGTKFEKKRQCPSSETLFSYQRHDLTSGQTSRITSHLSACDFCSAELELLSRYPYAIESYESPSLPVGLRALAEALLTGNSSGRTKLLERIYERIPGRGNIQGDNLIPGA
jgi:hypothetical protein